LKGQRKRLGGAGVVLRALWANRNLHLRRASIARLTPRHSMLAAHRAALV